MSSRWEREQENRERDAEDAVFFAAMCCECETHAKDATRKDGLCTRCGTNTDTPPVPHCPGCGHPHPEEDRQFCELCRSQGVHRRRYG